LSDTSSDHIQSHPCRVGFVVGLAAEARIAARCSDRVVAGGGTPTGAFEAARTLLADGAKALVSFGLAGGLDPAMRPGALLIPSRILHNGRTIAADLRLSQQFGGQTGHTLLAGAAIIADRAAKRALYENTGAHAVDLESGAVAEVAAAHKVPFTAVRAICDPAERCLPQAALIALDARGRISLLRVLASLARQPSQIGDLLRHRREGRC
jgi:adenosylhomocysteine nucleosidase